MIPPQPPKKYIIYSSIDTLPLFNYKKIIENHNLLFLLKSNIHTEISNINLNSLEKIWQDINNEIMDYNGLSERLKVSLLLENEILKLRLRAALEGDKSLLTIANIKEKELKKQLEDNRNMEIDEIIATIETKFKFQIDENKTTVKKFYSYLKLMTKANGK